MAGLRLAGFDVSIERPVAARPGDVLLIWNRYWDNDRLATEFERQGGTVLVAENGYLGMNRDDRQIYAMARHAHNGRGHWFAGGPERFKSLGIEVKPWRTDGDHILVAPNRSFGMPGGVMPEGWGERIAAELRRNTGRKVRLRPHPGNGRPVVPLDDDLRNAWAVVIWSSSVGVESLVRGIPVVCCAPWWICKRGALSSIGEVGSEPERTRALEEMAWAQWTVKEIADGTAFRHLLCGAAQGQVSPGS